MVLKKQTVWLMTMLSLTIVLAVYYITSPDDVAEEDPEALEDSDEVTAMTEDEELVEWLSDEEMETTIDETEPSSEKGAIEEDEGTDEEAVMEGETETDSNLFSELRLEREESRSRLREEYTETLASEDFSASEKSEAYEKRETLQERQQLESTLESLIQSEGYEEVVVLSNEDNTRIIVQAEDLTTEDAVALNRIAADQLGEEEIVIGHQPTASK
ncbi:SpoIIIAH-like family protein [Salibacterium salarium]|nr:SpoIIIAH-like family protein [Salibacterium salarium]